MKIQFEDYKRGGALFEIAPEQVDALDDLRENPVRPWINGVGLDEPDSSGEPLLLKSKTAVRRFLTEHARSNAGRLLQSLRKTRGGPPRRLKHDPKGYCRCYECRKARGDVRKPKS